MRDKPHVNIGLIAGFIVTAFALAAGLTYIYPDLIPPATELLFPGMSALRDPFVHAARALTNGLVYGLLTGVAVSIIMKGKKILQN
ncbi:hypothetical protein EU527_19770 [Candidatus Thorarchaeota archaeon]|nr:MAG: hypothetical protein EU527_19770 [Candidatus Thorarchaeota archaeon]